MYMYVDDESVTVCTYVTRLFTCSLYIITFIRIRYILFDRSMMSPGFI